MAIKQPVRLKGAPGSPYTRKMLAYLRYRHIGYQFLIGNHATDLGLPEPKVELLPTFYLPDERGDLQAVVDSTPLIRRFEAEVDGRHAVPDNPVLGFVNYLIEDYADEWLTKAMFHYRWYYEADIKMAGTILPLWRSIQMSDEQLQKMSAYIAERQISRLYVVGSNDITAPVIEDSYKRFLQIFDQLIQKQPFVLGRRPSSADFGLYAQLTQLAKFDPTPAALCMQVAPRVHAWTDLLDDQSGNAASADAWMSIDDVQATLAELLAEIGRVYVPALLANAAALQAGQAQMQATIDGRAWQQPVFPYQGKCLQWINEEYQRLTTSDQQQVNHILAGTGCEALLLTDL